MKKHPVRKGISPIVRPTEWTTAVVMLVLAWTQFQQNHDAAALMSTIGACLPALTTAVMSWWESRHADTVAVVPAVKE